VIQITTPISRNKFHLPQRTSQDRRSTEAGSVYSFTASTVQAELITKSCLLLDEFVENPEKFYKRRDETNKIRRRFRIHLRIFSKYGKKNRPGRCFSCSIAFKKLPKVAHFY
jgi:hypothetical protein